MSHRQQSAPTKTADQAATTELRPEQESAVVALPGALGAHNGLPPHPNNRGLRQRHLLQRQQAAGNRAARPTVFRDDAPAANSGLDAGMLVVNVSQQPASAGRVEVSKSGDGATGLAVLKAPQITYDAAVSLAPTVTLGNQNGVIKVGPVQTLVSSVRTGVYKKGNTVVAEFSQQLGTVRDARPLRYKDDPTGSTFAAESPFYDRHTTITDQSSTCNVHFVDQPTFPLPLEFGGGRLVAVKGADTFNTSIGAKREGAGIITLNPFGWKVDWTIDLAEDYTVKKDKDGNPLSSEIAIWKEAQGIAIDSPTYAKLLADQTPYIMLFRTVEAAMTEKAAVLWGALLPARAHDPAAAANIEEALRQKNPAFAIKLTAVKNATFWTDDIGLFAGVTKQTGTHGPFTMDEGDSQRIAIPLNDLCDPAEINSGSQLSVWVGGHGSEAILGDFAVFAHPFTGSRSVTVSSADRSGGEYTVEVSLA